tara:strand:- start:18762 stop:18896 length:135 start_codon:yes stop_codon:yes gene_type:complete
VKNAYNPLLFVKNDYFKGSEKQLPLVNNTYLLAVLVKFSYFIVV